MAQKKKTGAELQRLAAAISSGQLGRLYIFHGEERYLLEYRLREIRRALCPDGSGSFNFKRFDGSAMQLENLADAIDALPVFSERTLIEVHDFDVFKGSEDNKTRILEMLADLPEYVCLIFVYDTVPYKPDGRTKFASRLLELAEAVEFAVQEQDKLIKWIKMHFESAGKRVSTADAEHLAFITGGYMSALDGEIEKVAAYTQGEIVTRECINAVVQPVLDAVAYKMTDAIARGDYAGASSILDELLRMREAPHKLLYSISLKMRQLLAARICVENRLNTDGLMNMCGIRYQFQAKALMDSARKTTLAKCKDAVLICAETAYELNSMPEPEARLYELMTRLAFSERSAKR